MTDNALLEELKQAATPPPPANFRPGVIYSGRYPSEIVTPPLGEMHTEEEWEEAVKAMGVVLPDGMTLALVEAQYVYHDAFWKRDPVERESGGKEGEGEAYTSPSHSWRYRFKVVQKSARSDADIAVLMAEAIAGAPTSFAKTLTFGATSRVINLADFQTGKEDVLGGTPELLARSEAALAEVVFELENNPVDEIILVDPGDSTEGFESAPNAPQTNDLDQTEQIRVWRRILWRWIDALAPLAPVVKVVGVPSNHCRVRRGKNALGKPNDDWGIEVIAQVHDIAAANPERYGHIEFIVPNEYEEHVLITLAGGKVLGVVHGHQKANPHALAPWIKSTGRKGLAQADIVVVGHFHHLEVIAFGDLQWLFVCPTNDNGSSWYTPSSGERSEPGVLTFSVDKRGWYDLAPIWLGELPCSP